MTINRNDKSTTIRTQMDSMIPPSKISNLTQGMFVGVEGRERLDAGRNTGKLQPGQAGSPAGCHGRITNDEKLIHLIKK